MGHLVTWDRADAYALFEEHDKNFRGITPWLRSFYREYTNGGKIIALLDYWTFTVRCILAAYGLEGLRHFAKSGFRSPGRWAYLYEYGVDIDLKPRQRNGGLFFRAAAALLNAAFLPGGLIRSIRSRVLVRVSTQLALSAPVQSSVSRKSALVDKLAQLYPTEDEGAVRECIQAALPDVFSAEPISVPSRKKLAVDCGPATFMDFCGYENLLLLSRPTWIVGRQHGGGYGMFDVDYLLEYEPKFSDRFVGWGLLPGSERQHRYQPPSKASTERPSPTRVVVVERPLLPRMFFFQSPPSYLQYQNTQLIEYVHAELKASGRPFCNLPYPAGRSSPQYDGLRGEEVQSAAGRGESVIDRSDLVIFDISGASLIHYCIEHEIVFILVVSAEDLEHFSPAQAEWVAVLRDAGLVFRPDEPGKLAAKVREITSGSYEVPAAVTEYHRSKFVDLPGGAR